MPPNTTNATGNSTGNSTSTGAGGGGGGGGGDGGGGMIPDFPSGWDLVSSALQGALGDFQSGVARVIDAFHGRILTLPAPGSPADPTTWVDPSDPYWLAAGVVYATLAALAVLAVWTVGWFNVGIPRGIARRERLRTAATALVLIVAGYAVLLPAWFHLWNAAAVGMAPSGAEFMSTPGNAGRLGLGVLLGVGLAFVHGGIIIAGVGIHGLFVMLTYVFVALWPLSVALWASDSFAVETVGYSGLLATLALGPLQFAKACVLRLIFEAPMSPTDPATLVTAVLILIGLAIAFLLIPWEGLKRLIPRSIVSAGGQVGTRTGESAKERMADFRERVPSGSALREQVGSVASRSDQGAGDSRLGDRGGADEPLHARDRTPSPLSSTPSASRGDATDAAKNVRARTSPLSDRLANRTSRTETDGHDT